MAKGREKGEKREDVTGGCRIVVNSRCPAALKSFQIARFETIVIGQQSSLVSLHSRLVSIDIPGNYVLSVERCRVAIMRSHTHVYSMPHIHTHWRIRMQTRTQTPYKDFSSRVSRRDGSVKRVTNTFHVANKMAFAAGRGDRVRYFPGYS